MNGHTVAGNLEVERRVDKWQHSDAKECRSGRWFEQFRRVLNDALLNGDWRICLTYKRICRCIYVECVRIVGRRICDLPTETLLIVGTKDSFRVAKEHSAAKMWWWLSYAAVTCSQQDSMLFKAHHGIGMLVLILLWIVYGYQRLRHGFFTLPSNMPLRFVCYLRPSLRHISIGITGTAWWRLEILVVVSSDDHIVDLCGVVSFTRKQYRRSR